MIKYIKHIHGSFKNSLYGIKYSLPEKSFRIEIFMSFLIIPFSFYFIQDKIKLSIVILSWLLILIIELLNTAIEKTVDRISYKKHILSKQAKDIGSAAVFLSILNYVFIFFILLIY